MVTTWALKGLLYHDFGAYVYTIVVLGAFGYNGVILSKDSEFGGTRGPKDLLWYTIVVLGAFGIATWST